MDKTLTRKPFVFSPRELDRIRDEFDCTEEFTSGYLYYDEKTAVKKVFSDGVKVVLVGYILDISSGEKSAEEILKNLCELFSYEDKEAFYNQLDFMNGRYILIMDDGKDTQLYTDATCMRPVFYWNKEIFASHESLVNHAVEKEKNIKLNRDWYTMNGFLDYSNTEEIYKMNPNVLFSSVKKDFVRYYPRVTSQRLSVEDVIENTLPYYQPQTEWLKENYNKIYQSVTGGFDSKVSLALTKPIMENIEYFTYMINLDNTPDTPFSRIYKKDKDLVDRLIYNLRLDHKYYFFSDYVIPDEYEDTLKKTVSSNHSYILSYLTYKEFIPESVHVKSTIYEIAKLPFLIEYDHTEDVEKLLKVISTWAPKSFKKNTKWLTKMFKGYLERSKFDLSNEYSYNLPMLLYWETRMGNWHGNITHETDNTLETFIFVNNRYILNQFMFLEVGARRDKLYFTKIVERFWPMLNYFIPNSYKTLEDISEYSHSVKLEDTDVYLEELVNVEVSFAENNLYIKPKGGTRLRDDEVTFTIRNNTKSDKEIGIKGFYQHPQKNIFILIDGKSQSINVFKEGKSVILQAGSTMKIGYEYTKNFNRASWFEAGKLQVKML
ncbi:hypothetical protein [Salinicoccus sp. RF5]|uniref:hypothetical protein n=1 Tax=Salinicoccus sp. RF5 TaxID=2748874 RepID=UPI001E55DF92|nr:hypothetical protein [Salinicoccus sp. RF5]MCC4722382.1 hypothetical protein [Salinicoccus sp. RF5]